MTRFLFLPLLFVLVLPMFAQEEQAQLPPIPRDPRLFSQERERITFELQQIQRLIGAIRPDDVQTMDALKTQQAELAKQFRDLTQQMPNALDALPEQIPYTPSMRPLPSGGVNPQDPLVPMMPRSMPPVEYNPIPNAPTVPYPYNSQMPMYAPTPAVPMSNWADPLEAGQWGPRLAKELSETRQSVESLKKEVADLKDTIKALETQIQLLTRNILLSERAKENGN